MNRFFYFLVAGQFSALVLGAGGALTRNPWLVGAAVAWSAVQVFGYLALTTPHRKAPPVENVWTPEHVREAVEGGATTRRWALGLGLCAAVAAVCLWQGFAPVVAAIPSTLTPTVTVTPSVTQTASLTPTPAPTNTPLPSPTYGPRFPVLPPETATALAATQSYKLTPSATPIVTASPTATPTVTPSATSPALAMPKDNTLYPFVLQGGMLVYLANYANDSGCQWQGIAGQVLGADGNPLKGYTVELVDMDGLLSFDKAVTGSAPVYGPGGYEFRLGDQPLASRTRFFLRLRDEAGTQAAPLYTVETFASCRKNLILAIYVPRP